MNGKTISTYPEGERDSALAQELTACLQGREAEDGHLSTEEIFAYLGGHEGEDGDRIREHLVHCSRCLQDLLSAAEMNSPAHIGEEMNFEIAAAWRALTEKLRIEDLERQRDEAQQQLLRSQRTTRRWLRPLAALAACLFLFLGGVARRAHLDLRALEQPQLNALIEDVAVPTERTRGSAVAARVEFPADVSTVTLVFPLKSEQELTTHRVEILAEDGRLIWGTEGALRVDVGTWNLAVPRSFLEAGKYEVRLLGLDADGEFKELALYRFELEFSAVTD